MDFFCNKCKKKYSSYKCLWTHKKIYHNNNNNDTNNNIINTNDIICKYCTKKFVNKYSLKRHILKCNHKLFLENNKSITDNIQPNININNENENLKLKIQLTEIENKNLEKKDINQYETIGELADVISDYERDKAPKISESESIKLVDNDEIIIVRPLTHRSSCKYGSGTKWCTTHKETKYFNQYDGKGNLYYIHNKQVESDNPFYKIAAFVRYSGDEEWYDALDKRMSDGEVKLAKLLIKKSSLDLIKNDVQQTITSMRAETPNFRTEESMVNNAIETLEDRLDFSYTVEETNNSKYGYGELPLWFEVNSELGEVFGGTILETFMIGTSDTEKHKGVILGQMRIDVNEDRNEYKISYQIDSTSGIFGSEGDDERYPILKYVKKTHTYGIRGDNFNFNNFISFILLL